MALFSFFKQRTKSEPEPTCHYRGYEITPAPQEADGQYRIAALIRHEGLEHHMIRADLLPDRQACIEHSLRKAKALIDQQGTAIFQGKR